MLLCSICLFFFLTNSGCDNVMGVKLCLRNRDHVVFVMPVFLHDKFQVSIMYQLWSCFFCLHLLTKLTYVCIVNSLEVKFFLFVSLRFFITQECLHTMSVEEAREYMHNLLIALKRVHEFNVIHRDIKPSNFLYNRQQKRWAYFRSFNSIRNLYYRFLFPNLTVFFSSDFRWQILVQPLAQCSLTGIQRNMVMQAVQHINRLYQTRCLTSECPCRHLNLALTCLTFLLLIVLKER